jgi:FdrA protein
LVVSYKATSLLNKSLLLTHYSFCTRNGPIAFPPFFPSLESIVSILKAEIRSGAYYDSVILMQLQRALAGLPGVLDAGVVMGTPANLELLAQSELLPAEVKGVGADDLVIVVKAGEASAAQAALAQVDELLAQRRSQTATAYLPKSLETAAQMLPDARWVLVSVPGRYAAGVARQSLQLGKNVFLYSDNVSLADEVSLKQMAAQQGLLVMGPDCGTAIVNGVGLGFANRVRRGSIGLVGASGTGLQLVTARIHQLGGGVSHALGTGGRDLSEPVGAITARHALDLLARHAETEVIVLISKPPAPAVAGELLTAARATGKPVVINFIGHTAPEEIEGIHFARTLDETAELAVALAGGADARMRGSADARMRGSEEAKKREGEDPGDDATRNTHHVSRLTHHPSQKYLRGLFSGGTLAYEALLLLRNYLPLVYSNAPLPGGAKLENPHRSQGHTIVDLGEDEFTVGRLHPMLDNDLRMRRLQEEAEDPETAVILLDVVLGDGAHADPASELAPAIARAQATAQEAGRHLTVIAVVVGTDADPQEMEHQIEQLAQVGVHVFTRNDEAVRAAGARMRGGEDAKTRGSEDPGDDASRNTHHASRFTHHLSPSNPIDLSHLTAPLAAINVGLESFTQSLTGQGADVLHVDWRPPAGGNEKLMGILGRMRR